MADSHEPESARSRVCASVAVILAGFGVLLLLFSQPHTGGTLGGGPAGDAVVHIQMIANMIDYFRSRKGRYPQSLDEICELDQLCEKPYGRQFVDPWGTPYSYEAGDSYTLGSAGPDGRFGTSDDILWSEGEFLDR